MSFFGKVTYFVKFFRTALLKNTYERLLLAFDLRYNLVIHLVHNLFLVMENESESFDVTSNMFCANVKGLSACIGDLGSPLVCNKQNVFYLQGALSWIHPKCNDNFNIFAKISKFSGWIETNIYSEYVHGLLNTWSNHDDMLGSFTTWKVSKKRSFFWSLFSHIQSEYGKIRTRKNSVFGYFSNSVSFMKYSYCTMRKACLKIFVSHH